MIVFLIDSPFISSRWELCIQTIRIASASVFIANTAIPAHPLAAGLSSPWRSFRICHPSVPANRCAARWQQRLKAPVIRDKRLRLTAEPAAFGNYRLRGCASVQPATSSVSSTVRCNPAGRRCCQGALGFTATAGRLSAGSAPDRPFVLAERSETFGVSRWLVSMSGPRL